MSQASTSRTIKFIQKAGTYTAQLVSPSGDIFQLYEENSSANPTPDFSIAANQPILNMVVASSRVSENVNVSKVIFKWGDSPINKETNPSEIHSAFTNYFEILEPSTNSGYWGLKIKANIVDLAALKNAIIKAVAYVNYGTTSDTIAASYTIGIRTKGGKDEIVTIASGDDKCFVISNLGSSCKLRADVYINGAIANGTGASGFTYKWFKMETGAWQYLSSLSTRQITVCADEINTNGMYKVEVSKDGRVIGSDIQNVIDITDPLEILPNPNPTDETIYEGSNGSVTYSPTLINRQSGAEVFVQEFCFQLLKPDGVVIEEEAYGLTYTISYNTIAQAGCDLILNIEVDDGAIEY